MEVVSTSNQDSSEKEKTTACNFQTMTMNFFMPHDLMTCQRGSYAYMQTRTVKMHSKKHW